MVRRASGGRGWQRVDPATRTFQALRIWVNRELEGLDDFVRTAAASLAPGGREVIIAFHSLEDRIVKHTMRELAVGGGRRSTSSRGGRCTPDDAERDRNPRARSARLRALEKAA